MKAPIFAAVVLVGACGSVAAALYPPLAVRSPVGDPDAQNPISWTGGPKDIIAADLDGDGRRDIVTANLDGSVSVLLVKPTGVLPQILCPARGLLEGASLRAVCAADLDEDGRPDVAAADITGHVVLLRGQGDGRLIPVWRTFVGPARAIAAGDLTGDGHADLLVGCSPPDCELLCGEARPIEGRCVHLLAGNGRGSFGEPATVAAGLSGCVYDLLLADVDRDGSLDAVTLEYLCGGEAGGRQGVGYLTVLGNDGLGVLRPANVLRTNGLGGRSVAAAFLDESRDGSGSVPADATVDIFVANRDSGTIEVFPGLGDFGFADSRSVFVGDAPRSVAAGDLDRDGLVDLVVTNRNANSISVLLNLDEIAFSEPVELPAGTSPRELVVEDLDGDGLEDAAVANRVSEDVSFYRGTELPPGLQISKGFYRAGTTPLDVVTGDFNGDGYPDVAVVSTRSHDLHVRLGDGTGALGDEAVYPLNHAPTTLAAADLDGDGALDLVAACSGRRSEPGVPSVPGAPEPSGTSTQPALVTLRGLGDGSFEAGVPTVMAGIQPYWLRLGDLSGDGAPDAAVSGLDGSLTLLEGVGDGRFGRTSSLSIEADGRPVTMTLGDFDRDGRLDLATSRCVLYLNDDRFFEPGWSGDVRTFGVTAPPGTTVRSFVIESTDLDTDGNLDVLLTVTFVRPDPIAVFYGNGDGTFGTPDIYEGPDIGVVDIAAADADGDGTKDLFIGNRCGSNVIIMRGTGDRKFEPLETVTAFHVEGIAVDDLNRDGRPDIVGAGLGLWASVNGDESAWVELPSDDPTVLQREEGLLINELVPQNTTLEGGSSPDWIEILNASPIARSLDGWKLRQYGNDEMVVDWPIPAGTVMEPGAHRVVWCETKPIPRAGLVCHAFELDAAEGETVALVDPAGSESSRVSFPPLPPNVAWARCRDASLQFGISPMPSLGRTNFRPGNMDPWVVPGNPRIVPGTDRLAVTARPMDDLGIAYASVHFQLPATGEAWETVLQDDGRHGDGAAGDGVFAAALPDLPPETDVRYYFRVVDLEGQVATDPGDPAVVSSLPLLRTPPADRPLRISELVADNGGELRDERGEPEDWVEIANCGSETIPLGGLALAKRISVDALWELPAGLAVAPGRRIVVFCDDDPTDGPLHASFKLNRAGDEVLLVRIGDPPIVLDSLAFGSLEGGRSFGPAECGGMPTALARPTPGAPNSAAASAFVRGDANSDGNLDISDPVGVLAYLFLGGRQPDCLSAADANDDGEVRLTDAVVVLLHLFLSGPWPAPPYPTCGADATPDGLPCDAYPPCG